MCVNLLQTFGHKYRVEYDPAYDSRGVRKRTLDPWYMVIPCKYGFIYPHGTANLAVEVDYHPGIARELAQLDGVRCTQDGDKEKTFVFDVGLFERVAEIVQPRKRRQITREEKARLAEIGRRSLSNHRNLNVQVSKTDPRINPEGQR